MSKPDDNQRYARIRELATKFEKAHFQGYVHVTFCNAAWSWGWLSYRKRMSGGPDGELGFSSLEECEFALVALTTK
jgi:hypothetical protein